MKIPFLNKKNNAPWEIQEFVPTERISFENGPDRGWYNIYTLRADRKFDESELKAVINKEQNLALVHIDLGGLGDEPMDDKIIGRIKAYLRIFDKYEKDIILRVAYDHEGKAIEHEPFFFKTVTDHLSAMTGLLSSFDNSVFIWQGLLIGNWGEMHTSRFLQPGKVSALMEQLRLERQDSYFLAVRKPSVWRNFHASEDIKNGAMFDRVGLFDDAILGSESDMGTFGDRAKGIAGWDASWCRNDEVDFVDELCRYVPNGGEVVYSSFSADMKQDRVVDYLRRMHVTYLNSQHDEKILKLWKSWTYTGEGAWAGQNFYDYISAHLGYRFLVTAVEVTPITGEADINRCRINLTIQNQGFAAIYREVFLDLVLLDSRGNEMDRVVVSGDLRSLSAGESWKFTTELLCRNGQLVLESYTKFKNRPIWFANEGAEPGRFRIGYLARRGSGPKRLF